MPASTTIPALREQVANAEHMSDLALSSMGDSGVALQFMSKLVGGESEVDLAENLLQVLAYFRLGGAIEARVGERSYVATTCRWKPRSSATFATWTASSSSARARSTTWTTSP